jgi:hypothetical protein
MAGRVGLGKWKGSLMRANPAIDLPAAIAIETEDLKPFGEVVSYKPLVKSCTHSSFLSMRNAIVIDVVNSQESRVGFITTSANIPVMVKHLLLEKSGTFKGIFELWLGVFTVGIKRTLFKFIAVSNVISFLVFKNFLTVFGIGLPPTSNNHLAFFNTVTLPVKSRTFFTHGLPDVFRLCLKTKVFLRLICIALVAMFNHNTILSRKENNCNLFSII